MKQVTRLDKKTWKHLDIYYIGYIDKKPDWNVDSVNPLYLMINRFYGHIEEENGVKYLTITDISRNSNVLKKYDQLFSGIKHHIKKLIIVIVNMTKITKKIEFLSDDSFIGQNGIFSNSYCNYQMCF